VPSNNEIVTHLDTGLLYTYGDEKDLGEKLTLLLSDDELYRKVQVKARDRAEQWFDMSKMVSRTEDHFLRLVSRASR
jgi:glycosyltransferase involved in cell wall biosynthesis